jgi:hypothetical protein
MQPALMGIQVIYVFTHDSLSLGEVILLPLSGHTEEKRRV